jgi:leader peptidase (prepilin peptidase) / N-methyltransferase
MTTGLFYIFVFLLGLIIGSFLNCVIYRLEIAEGKPRKEAFSFLRGRSYCPNCKHVLSWQDLIPLFSFIFLAGKCRYCKKKISWQYPLVELLTGIVFLAVFNFNFIFPDFFNLIYLFIISSLLIIIFVFDLKHYIIPDGGVYSAIAISLIFTLYSGIFKISILSALGASAFFLLVFLVSQGRWMGFGDVKLAFMMGLFLGYPNIIVALFMAFFIGAIIGVCLIISGRKKFSSEVPFGPFLIFGTFLALFFGENLINWYLNLITF